MIHGQTAFLLVSLRFSEMVRGSTACPGLGKEGAASLLPYPSPVTSFSKMSNISDLDLGFPSTPKRLVRDSGVKPIAQSRMIKLCLPSPPQRRP